jgi:hypothetical protein
MTLDVFKADGFSVTNLSLAIAEMDFVPSKVTDMGLFRTEGVTTTTVQVEKRRDGLFLVPSSARGGPGYAINQDRRSLRTFTVPHFQLDDAIQADEVQNIRAFGTDSELETVQARLNQKLMRGARSIDATIEFQRVKAIQGQLVDVRPNGTGNVAGTITNNYTTETLYDYYTEFGYTQRTFDFPFSNAGLKVIQKLTEMRKALQDELGMAPMQRLYVLCGSDWFDALVSHASITAAYSNYWGGPRMVNDPLTQDLWYAEFVHAGIVFVVYYGQVGNQPFVPVDQAFAFPLGVPDMFVSYFAPADYVETVNTEGMPRYAKQYETLNGKAIQIEMQTNHLALLTRPNLVFKLTKS